MEVPDEGWRSADDEGSSTRDESCYTLSMSQSTPDSSGPPRDITILSFLEHKDSHAH
ncbi:hypothetical protein BaRGS_00014044, partial [Batillaria attramentaria]